MHADGVVSENLETHHKIIMQGRAQTTYDYVWAVSLRKPLLSVPMSSSARCIDACWTPAHGRKFQLLKSFPNVLISPHSAFLTHEALANIADTTVANLQVT